MLWHTETINTNVKSCSKVVHFQIGTDQWAMVWAMFVQYYNAYLIKGIYYAFLKMNTYLR